MASKEEVYAGLAEKIERLNQELIRFTHQAEATQQVVLKACNVTTLYSSM